MFDMKLTLGVVLALGLAAPAMAQDTTTTDGAATEAPAAPAEPAAPAAPAEAAPAAAAPAADGVGSVYTAETHGAWDLRCERTADGSDPCQMYQLLKDEKGNSVAEISMFGLPAGGEAVVGATIVTPLETLLPPGLAFAIDGAEGKVYPYSVCAQIGCIARVGFTAAELDALKKGSKGTLTIIPAAAPDQRVALNVSLDGFTAAFDAVQKANAPKQP